MHHGMRLGFRLMVVLVSALVCSGAVTVTKVGGVFTPAQGTVNNTGGKWQVDFLGPASGQYVISSGSADVIEYIRSAANNSVEISTDDVNIPLRIEEIKRTGGSGVLVIGTVRAFSHLGPANRATDTRIIVNGVATRLRSETGNLHCGIEIINTGSPFVNPFLNGLELPSGQLLGNITNVNGAFSGIDGISCLSVGGTTSQPVVITTDGNVFGINVAGVASNFHIVDPQTSQAARTLQVVGPVTISGSMSGTISAAGFQFQPDIWRATVTIGSDFTGFIDAPDVGFGGLIPLDDFRSFPSVRIGGSLTAGSIVRAGQYSSSTSLGGLGSVVIINGNHTDAVPGTGTMDGDASYVNAGGTPTTLPVVRTGGLSYGQYSTLPAQFGYGSVGVMPFGLHGPASKMYTISKDRISGTPLKHVVRGPFSPSANGLPNEAVNIPYAGIPELLNFRMEFYGPVASGRGSGFGQGDEEPEAELIWEYRLSNTSTSCWTPTGIGFKNNQFTPRNIELFGALPILASDIANLPVETPPLEWWTPGQAGSPQPGVLGPLNNPAQPPGSSECIPPRRA